MNLQCSPVKLEAKDRSVKIGGYVLTETVRSSGKVIPPHYHEHTNISFVLFGSFIETIGNKPYELRPGSVVLRPAGEIHKNQYGATPTRSLIIEVSNPRLKAIRETSNLLDSVFHLRDSLMTNLALRIHHEFRQSDEASPLAIEGLILEMLAQGVRCNPKNYSRKKPRWLEQVLDFIHAEFAQPLSLSAIAETNGVHPAHLAKVFRLHFNCTMGEYVRRLRVEYAEKELASSDKSLSEIALSAGFYDQSHFANVFKLRYGVTPSEFRILARKK